MESPPILYGKDVNTGAITQLNSIGNLLMLSNKLNDLSDVIITTPSTGQSLRYNGTNWVNATRDYLSLEIYGPANPSLYEFDSNFKSVLIYNSAYWDTSAPYNIKTNLTTNNVSYDFVTGWITLNSYKTYRIDAVASMSNWNIPTVTNWTCQLVRGDGAILRSMAATQHNDWFMTNINVSTFYTTNTTDPNLLKFTLQMKSSDTAGVAIDVISEGIGSIISSAFTITVQEV
jgi:hypothetical protein